MIHAEEEAGSIPVFADPWQAAAKDQPILWQRARSALDCRDNTGVFDTAVTTASEKPPVLRVTYADQHKVEAEQPMLWQHQIGHSEASHFAGPHHGWKRHQQEDGIVDRAPRERQRHLGAPEYDRAWIVVRQWHQRLPLSIHVPCCVEVTPEMTVRVCDSQDRLEEMVARQAIHV